MERRSWRWYSVCALIAAHMVSCSTTRNLPQERYLVQKVRVVADEGIPRKERITSSDVDGYIRQSANRKFLGTNFYLWAYNASDTTKSGRWHRFLRRIGDPPVALDTVLVRRSENNLQEYMRLKGYFNSEVSHRIDTSGRKVTVTYFLEQGEPYRIGNMGYYFRDEAIGPVILQDTASRLIKQGDPMDLGLLNGERVRITEYLRNRGYYYFNVNNITYAADTVTTQENVVDLTLVVNPSITGYDNTGRPLYEDNKVYRIGDIYINPDYDPGKALEPDYYTGMDTISYRGLKILSRTQNPRIRKRILRQHVSIYPNYLYDASQVSETYANLMRLGYYSTASIQFREVSDSTRNLITYIGDDRADEGVERLVTREAYLEGNINAIPAKRQSYMVELEGATSSNFYSLSAIARYQNRNLFRGAELFNVNFKGTYEFMRNRETSGAYELGGLTSMSFPRFIFPLRLDPYHRAFTPRTKVEFSFTSQKRKWYERNISSATWTYSWSNRGRSSYIVRPVDINVVKMGHVDRAFVDSLKNEYLRESFNTRLVAGISGSYVYNTQLNTASNANSMLLRFNWETAGNLINGISRAFLSEHTDTAGNGYYKIFGIRYAQYYRVDVNFSNRLAVGSRSSVVYRIFAGVAGTYGNSKSEPIPYDRQFYAGGNSSMRGWVARDLGPGEVRRTWSYPSQSGDMKLEMNFEARFPVWNLLHGVVFFDAGNVWYIKQRNYDPAGVFHFDTFYKQLGFNTGVGIRFDINFAVLRFDWGIKLHDPNAERKWIDRFKMSDTTLSFGVGYPF